MTAFTPSAHPVPVDVNCAAHLRCAPRSGPVDLYPCRWSTVVRVEGRVTIGRSHAPPVLIVGPSAIVARLRSGEPVSAGSRGRHGDLSRDRTSMESSSTGRCRCRRRNPEPWKPIVRRLNPVNTPAHFSTGADCAVFNRSRHPGCCFENAAVESFWARMQVELLNTRAWATTIELAAALAYYIDIVYNDERRDSAQRFRSRDAATSVTSAPQVRNALHVHLFDPSIRMVTARNDGADQSDSLP